MARHTSQAGLCPCLPHSTLPFACTLWSTDNVSVPCCQAAFSRTLDIHPPSTLKQECYNKPHLLLALHAVPLPRLQRLRAVTQSSLPQVANACSVAQYCTAWRSGAGWHEKPCNLLHAGFVCPALVVSSWCTPAPPACNRSSSSTAVSTPPPLHLQQPPFASPALCCRAAWRLM